MTFTASAHGRVNLIGEHTDYNEGFVFPTGIPQSTTVQLRLTGDKRARVKSRNISGAGHEYILGEEKASRHWADYVQGVTWILRREGFEIPGFEVDIESDVPMGSGLSSSAALEVALLRVFSQALGLNLDPLRIAKLGQKVENDFVGARVGIMDQMAASLGNFGEALFIDTRDLKFDRIPLPLDSAELLVINSGVAHNHAAGDYNQRRAECEKACEILGIKSLRDIETDLLESHRKELPPVLFARAKHVVTENLRVLQAVEYLGDGDFEAVGRLFVKSHESMRDDYQVSVPEVDLLVDLTMKRPDVWGARLTGGGFGGSIVALCRPETAANVGREVCAEYRERSGRNPSMLVPS